MLADIRKSRFNIGIIHMGSGYDASSHVSLDIPLI